MTGYRYRGWHVRFLLQLEWVIWFSGRSILDEQASTLWSLASFLMACIRKREREIAGWMPWWTTPLTRVYSFPIEHLGGDVIPSPSCMSCRSRSGVMDVVVLPEGFLEVLILLSWWDTEAGAQDYLFRSHGSNEDGRLLLSDNLRWTNLCCSASRAC